MEYDTLSRYNIFRNISKEMGENMARCVGGRRQLIGGFDVSEGEKREYEYLIFGRRYS